MKKYLSIAAALIVMVGVVATTGTAGTSNEEPCEPQDAWTDTTGWVLESPGAGWHQIESRDGRSTCRPPKTGGRTGLRPHRQVAMSDYAAFVPRHRHWQNNWVKNVSG